MPVRATNLNRTDDTLGQTVCAGVSLVSRERLRQLAFDASRRVGGGRKEDLTTEGRVSWRRVSSLRKFNGASDRSKEVRPKFGLYQEQVKYPSGETHRTPFRLGKENES